MNVVFEKEFMGQHICLVSNADIIQVFYGKVLLDTIKDFAFIKLKQNDLLDDYLDIVVGSYLKDLESKEEFEDMCKKLGWN